MLNGSKHHRILYTIVIIAMWWISCNQATEKPVQQEPLKKEVALTSTLTCPFCQYRQTETLPTDYCLIKYTCKRCNKTIHPKDEDCCVFCSYGDHKCPSKQ